MSGPLRRNAEEILEALEAAAHTFKRALRDRQRDQANAIRERNRAIQDKDDELSERQQQLTSGPVHELDIGTYRDLRRREVTGDQMQHDHIPSTAALIRARELELGRKLKPHERDEIRDNAVTVELRDALHAASRTFKWKNTSQQIELDARDLRAAAERDYQVLRINLITDGGYSPATANAVINRLRELNSLLGR